MYSGKYPYKFNELNIWPNVKISKLGITEPVGQFRVDNFKHCFNLIKIYFFPLGSSALYLQSIGADPRCSDTVVRGAIALLLFLSLYISVSLELSVYTAWGRGKYQND